MERDFREVVQSWLDVNFDEATKAQIRELQENDLAAFKQYLEQQRNTEDSPLYNALSGVSYSYNIDMLVYTKEEDGSILLSDTQSLMRDMLIKHFGQNMAGGSSSGASGMSSMMATSERLQRTYGAFE